MVKIYETERLMLMSLNKDSAHLVLSFYEENKDAFESWEPVRGQNFYTLSYHNRRATAEYNQMAEGKLIRFWIFLKDNPEEIIGSICFQNLLKEPYQSCSLGYKISQKHQHQGYAMESISRCLTIIFKEYHLHRVEAYIMRNNKPSLHLIKKLSFQYEGISHSCARINGVWTDHKRYALINPDELP